MGAQLRSRTTDVATGTCAGVVLRQVVDNLQHIKRLAGRWAGDTVDVEIEGLGVLSNTVR